MESSTQARDGAPEDRRTGSSMASTPPASAPSTAESLSGSTGSASTSMAPGEDATPEQLPHQRNSRLVIQTPASSSSSPSGVPPPRPPPMALRSPHSIASTPSALHRIAEDPDQQLNEVTAAHAANPTDRVPTGLEHSVSQSASDVPTGFSELGFAAAAAAADPVLTSTPASESSFQLEAAPGFQSNISSSGYGAGAGASAVGASSRKPFQRTLSMPLANKLGPLQKPTRPQQQQVAIQRASSSTGFVTARQGGSSTGSEPTAPTLDETTSSTLQTQGHSEAVGALTQRAEQESGREVATSRSQDESNEDDAPFSSLLADTLQLSISTLLHIISPHLLDPSHERYSASSIQVPVTSVEALLESHRALNWLCAKMDDLATPVSDFANPTDGLATSTGRGQHLAAPEGATSSVNPLEQHQSGVREVSTSESPTTASFASTSQAPSSLSSFSRVDRSGTSTSMSSLPSGRQVPAQSRASSALFIPSKGQMGDPSAEAIASTSETGPKEVDFDITELVQRAADAVSGQAAARGVELALCLPRYRSKKGGTETSTSLSRLLGISVRGDEGAVRFGMLHALGKVIEQCQRDETVHAALCVTELEEDSGTSEPPNGKGKARDSGAVMQCCLHIYRTTEAAPASGSSTTSAKDASSVPQDGKLRRRPLERALSTKFLQSIACEVNVREVPWPSVLHDHGMALPAGSDANVSSATSETTTNAPTATATQYTLKYLLKRGGPLVEAAAVDLRESFSRQRYLPSISVGREPSLGELVSFVEQELKAKSRTVAFHAHGESTSAKQLISMLSSWGCSVALFPLPRIARAPVPLAATSPGGVGLNVEPLPPGEETGLWAGVPHEYATSLDVFAGAANDPDASLGSEVDAAGIPLEGGSQRVLRTAVALNPDGKPTLVSYPSGLQLPLLPPSSSSSGARRPRGSADTVMDNGFPSSAGSAAPAAPAIDAAVLDPVTGVPLAVTADSPGTIVPSDGASAEDTVTAGLSSQIVPFSFVIIDDDVEVLQRELLRLQSAVPMLRSAMGSPVQTPGVAGAPTMDVSARATLPRTSSLPKTRPALPHRGTSNAQVQRVMAEERGEAYLKQTQPSGAGGTPMRKVPSAADSPTFAIIHLTSLGNFRLVRDFIKSMVESTNAQQRAGVPLSLPEILVLPKPIGPRRLLTTLHTAVHKPLVDEFFLPIATSPLSPGMAAVQSPAAVADPLNRFKPSKLGDSDLDPVSRRSTPLNLATGQSGQRETKAEPTLAQSPALPDKTSKEPEARKPAEASAPIEKDHAQQGTASAGIAAKVRPEGSLPIPTTSPGAQTPWSGASLPGRRSHPSSPLPMDALEYFNETASRMGSRAASGMLVQSADGKAAGIFFRPGDHGRSQGGSAFHRRDSGGKTESERSGGTSQIPVSLRWPPASQRSGDGLLRETRSKSSTTVAADIDSESSSSSRRMRSPSIGQQVNARGIPSGSLFSPGVGIEAVLAGSAPPVATPLGPPTGHGGTPSLWDSSALPPRPGPAAVIAASGTPSHRSPQQSSTVSPPDASMPPPPSPGESPVPKELELPPESPGGVRPDARSGSGAGVLADIPEHQPATNQLLPSHLQPPQRSGTAMTPQPSGRGAKPSALPQPGLLIGAGFAPKNKKVSAPRKALVREPVLPPIKVLIVEDNPINQRIMAKFMDKKKIKYEIATNGRDAIERWQSGGFHLILMDIQLPVMDGIEATREIRRLERSANIGILPNTPPAHTTSSRREMDNPSFSPAQAPLSPFRASVIIVALTASVFHPDRVAALAAGCNDYLTKPVKHDWLEKKIIEWGSMQYILLSGFPSDNWDRWREERRIDAASVAAGPGAGRQVARDIRRGFNTGPDENARRLASKLHIARPPRSGRASPGPPAQDQAGTSAAQHSRPTPCPHGTNEQRTPASRASQHSGDSGNSSTNSSIRLDVAGQMRQLNAIHSSTSSADRVPTLSTIAGVGVVESGHLTPPPPLAGAGASGGEEPIIRTPQAAKQHTQRQAQGAETRREADDNDQQSAPKASTHAAASLAVAPLQGSGPPASVTDEEAERLINENQVTGTVPGDSAVRELEQ